MIKQPNDNIDPYVNYWKPSPETYQLEAYLADGTPLWTYDLGWAIERGIWYSPYVVADLDGDGRAEVAVKTGEEGDPRDAEGRVQEGPEYLTILDGQTGKPMSRIDWPSRQPFLDANPEPLRGYNYASRNQLAVVKLDGKNPYLVVLRGTYNLMVVQAYRYEKGELKNVWRWDNVGLGKEYQGQGAHWTHAADVDGDGREEVVLGSLVLDDNGKPLWTTGMGHPDHAYVGDIDPTRPGLEIYYGYETRQKKNGMCLVDAATGKILWGHDQPTRHVHGQGLCADLDAGYPGSECYSADTDANKNYEYSRLRTAKGQVISEENLGGFALGALYWDADLQRELMRGPGDHRLRRQAAACGPHRGERGGGGRPGGRLARGAGRDRAGRAADLCHDDTGEGPAGDLAGRSDLPGRRVARVDGLLPGADDELRPAGHAIEVTGEWACGRAISGLPGCRLVGGVEAAPAISRK